MNPLPRRAAPRGAAAVEFAIVLPLLLVIVMGTVDWGHYFFTRETVVHAAREGARAGTLVPPGDDPRADARAGAAAFLTSASLDGASALARSCGAGVAAPCIASGTTEAGGVSSVFVEIHYPAGSLTGVLGPLVPAEATARAEMRR